MSQEAFVCCDNPDCSSAIRDDDATLVSEWWHASFNRNDWTYEDVGDVPELDACSQKCLAAAITAYEWPV